MRISSAPLKQPRRNDGGELPGQRAAKCYLESWGFWGKIEHRTNHLTHSDDNSTPRSPHRAPAQRTRADIYCEGKERGESDDLVLNVAGTSVRRESSEQAAHHRAHATLSVRDAKRPSTHCFPAFGRRS